MTKMQLRQSKRNLEKTENITGGGKQSKTGRKTEEDKLRRKREMEEDMTGRSRQNRQ